MSIAKRATPLTEKERAQLCPTGRLRAGIAVGPAGSAVWATRDDATGRPRGVTVDLSAALALWLDVPLELVELASSGAIIEAADGNVWDVSYTPVDAERKTRVDFGPNYFLGESTYMVRPGSSITSIEEVNRPGVRVIGVEGTATLRSARRTLSQTEARGVTGLDEALALFTAGEADAVALGRESLISLLPKIPGARMLDGAFHAAGTAVAVPKGHAAALACVTEFIEMAKENGTVRAIFDRHGMADSALAPAGSRS